MSVLVTVVIGGIGSYFTFENANDLAYQYKNTTKAILYTAEVKFNVATIQRLVLQTALDKKSALNDT